MGDAPPHPRESARLAALRGLEILDTGPELIWDQLVDLARQVCDTPVALVTLVDEDRQWFKANVGFPWPETSREYSFCAHAILEDDILVVEDTLSDDRLADNPFVAGEPNIRFYAGVPLKAPGGLPIGTLCVLDQEPRGLTAAQKADLRLLARQAEALLVLRKALLDIKHYMDQEDGDTRRVDIDAAAQVRATMTPVLLNIYLLEKGVEDPGLTKSLTNIRASVERLLETTDAMAADQTQTA